ncbi:MAG: hypothetical protein R2706_01740 [Acidimicrobiales bacterium]
MTAVDQPLDELLELSNTDVDALVHHVKNNAESIFTWDYEKGCDPG